MSVCVCVCVCVWPHKAATCTSSPLSPPFSLPFPSLSTPTLPRLPQTDRVVVVLVLDTEEALTGAAAAGARLATAARHNLRQKPAGHVHHGALTQGR